MNKRTRAARQDLDAEAVLAFIRQRFDRHRKGLEEIVRELLAVATLEPGFDTEMRVRGLADWAGDHLLKGPRTEILRSVSVSHHQAPDADPHTITVRSVLRDWPIGVCKGLSLELCTIEDLEREIYHSERTADEILRRVRVLKAVVKAGRRQGCTVAGELNDALLDKCLEQGRMD